MNPRTISALCAITLLTSMSVAMVHASPGFTEDFTASGEGWLTRSFAPVTHNASGGPDNGSYVSFVSSFDPFGTAAVAFRGHDDFDASNDAFVGDWVTNHWVTLSAYVRHNGQAPAEFFARIATTNNFPGAAIENGVLVQPNTWTLVSFDVNPNNPLLTLEGPIAFGDVFEHVGNVQFGLTSPAGYEDDTSPITFALDKVTVAIPEPASCGLLLLGLGGTLLRRRK